MLESEECPEIDYKSEIFPFESETSQLMKLIINSFYSNKDIFLRELISNCSDSLNKLRHSKMSEHNSTGDEPLKIRIKPDKNNGVLSITDNGVGMSKEELIQNIGTIANSGTIKYIQELNNNKNKDKNRLIGQFGVGFYSVFLVADRVQIITKSYKGNQYTWLWESDSIGHYKIIQLPNNDIKHGCTIKLYLKTENLEYLDQFKLRDIVKEHTQFVNYMVEILVKKNIGSGKSIKNGGSNFFDSESSTNKEYIYSWEPVIMEQPIWEKNPNENSIFDYNHLYKSITNDSLEPLKYKHFIIEGTKNFKGVIFIPSKPKEDIFSPKKNKIKFKLYSKRVFVMDNCEGLIPNWLSFIRGVVDSYEIPLNVSREILQENDIISVINRRIISKTIEMIEEIYQDKDLKNSFYSSFSKNIKYAIYQSQDYKDKISQFLQFYTTNSNSELRTLDQYICNFKSRQKYIYYITGESLQSVKESVFLENFISHGIEVIFMTDTIDEYMLQNFSKYKEFELISVYHQNIKDFLPFTISIGNEQKYEQLLKLFKITLYPNVEDVIISNRLIQSPACIISTKNGWTPNMERIMKAQALGGEEYKNYIGNQKIIEINDKHLLIQKINRLLKQGININYERIIYMIYNISCLLSGFTVSNLSELCTNLYDNLEREIVPHSYEEF